MFRWLFLIFNQKESKWMNLIKKWSKIVGFQHRRLIKIRFRHQNPNCRIFVVRILLSKFLRPADGGGKGMVPRQVQCLQNHPLHQVAGVKDSFLWPNELKVKIKVFSFGSLELSTLVLTLLIKWRDGWFITQDGGRPSEELKSCSSHFWSSSK